LGGVKSSTLNIYSIAENSAIVTKMHSKYQQGSLRQLLCKALQGLHSALNVPKKGRFWGILASGGIFLPKEI
jgi:hypothetical protein